jgi:hypothetical protein
MKVKYAQDGKPSRGRPFEGEVKEETETHITLTCGAKGDVKFSKKTGLGRCKGADGEGRQVILDGYPKEAAAA